MGNAFKLRRVLDLRNYRLPKQETTNDLGVISILQGRHAATVRAALCQLVQAAGCRIGSHLIFSCQWIIKPFQSHIAEL